MARFLSLLLTAALATAPAPLFAQNLGGPEASRSAKDGAARRAAPREDIEFGDDSGRFAQDGECDDPRFTGSGMASPPLSQDNLGGDASDCREAHAAGTIRLREVLTEPVTHDGVLFGLDSGVWANDGECDDPRFIGEGMTATPLLGMDAEADASDCLAAYKAGEIRLRTASDPAPLTIEEWMAQNPGLDEGGEPVVFDGIDFGRDSGNFANDGECDDPRFEGEGMTATTLLDSDIRADASDCLAAYKAGTVVLQEAAEEL